MTVNEIMSNLFAGQIDDESSRYFIFANTTLKRRFCAFSFGHNV